VDAIATVDIGGIVSQIRVYGPAMRDITGTSVSEFTQSPFKGGHNSAMGQTRAKLVWESSQRQLVASPTGLILSDDVVPDRQYSHKIRPMRQQWVWLKQVAHEASQTAYQPKHGMLPGYLRQQSELTSVRMALA
jgi:hypothetical protein